MLITISWRVLWSTLFAITFVAIPCFAALAADPETPSDAIVIEQQDVHVDEDEEFEDLIDDKDAAPTIADPLETFNRGMFWFNDRLYVYVLKPTTKVVRYIPEDVRVCFSNFVRNLTTPIRFFNTLFQGKIHDAGNEFGRFMINTTLGIGGLFDPAKTRGNLLPKNEDFGQTLGSWGVGSGAYLVLPFFGPSTIRDGIGDIVDSTWDPLSQYLEGRDYWTTKTVDVVNSLSLDKDTYETIKQNSFDPYLFLRDAYVQNRQAKINQ